MLDFILDNLRFDAVDVSLLLLCPLCAALGVLVSFILKEREKISNNPSIMKIFYLIGAYIGNLFVGLVLGLIIALFFIGSINDEKSSLARVLALSILLGYQARYL